MNNHHLLSPKFTKIHQKGDKTQLNGLGAGVGATAGVAASAEAELVPVRCCRRRPHPASCGSAWRNCFPMRDALRENSTLPCDESHGKGTYMHGKAFAVRSRTVTTGRQRH
jgi:hypothetical protein